MLSKYCYLLYSASLICLCKNLINKTEKNLGTVRRLSMATVVYLRVIDCEH